MAHFVRIPFTRLPDPPKEWDPKWGANLIRVLTLNSKRRDELAIPIEILMAAGEVSGATTVNKFGSNFAISNASETIWPEGGVYIHPSSATSMTVSSASGNDVLTSGSGAWTVTVEGLDSNYNEVSQTANLNGTSGVTLSTNLIRINHLFIATANQTTPSTAGNAGIVYVGSGSLSSGKPTNVFGLIEALANRSQMAFYTVPADKTAYLYNVQISSGGKAAKDIIVDFLARPDGGTLEKVLTFSIADTGQDIERSLRSAPKKMTEKTDIETRAIASASGSSDISVDFDLILVDD